MPLGSRSPAESSGMDLVPIHQVYPVTLNVSLGCWVSSWHGEQGRGWGSLGEAIRVWGARLCMSPSRACPSCRTACRILV